MIFAIVLLTAFINLFLGILSYNKNPKSVTHKLLAVLTLIFALWTVTNYFSLNSATEGDTLFWIRAVMLITAPLGPVIYLLIKAFPRPDLKISRMESLILWGATAVLAALSFTPLMFSGVTINEGITPTPGPGIILFGVVLVGSFVAGAIELFKKYRRSQGIERLQLKYFIAGLIGTFGLQILTNFIFVILFDISEFVLFGPIFSLFFAGCITYAIIKHRLLDIRLILMRSVAYALLLPSYELLIPVGNE